MFSLLRPPLLHGGRLARFTAPLRRLAGLAPFMRQTSRFNQIAIEAYQLDVQNQRNLVAFADAWQQLLPWLQAVEDLGGAEALRLLCHLHLPPGDGDAPHTRLLDTLCRASRFAYLTRRAEGGVRIASWQQARGAPVALLYLYAAPAAWTNPELRPWLTEAKRIVGGSR